MYATAVQSGRVGVVVNRDCNSECSVRVCQKRNDRAPRELSSQAELQVASDAAVCHTLIGSNNQPPNPKTAH